MNISTTELDCCPFDRIAVLLALFLAIESTAIAIGGDDRIEARFDAMLDRMQNARTASNRRAGAEDLFKLLVDAERAGKSVPDERIRLAAVAFAEHLGHDDLSFRATSIAMLTRYGSENEIPKLRDALKKSTGWDDGWPVATALAALNDRKSAIAFAEKSAAGDTLLPAIHGLGDLAGDDAKAALERLRKKHPKLKDQIDAQIDRIDGRSE